MSDRNYCKHGHYEEDNPYWPDCLNEETLRRCLECEHLAQDHHLGGYCEKGECRCPKFDKGEPTNCEYGCPYGSQEHEARLWEWERTGKW